MIDFNHNRPKRPPIKVLKHIEKNFEIRPHGCIYSRAKRRIVGSKRNGCAKSDGYSRVCTKVDKKKYYLKTHHVVWFLHHGRWPDWSLDHIDRNRTNNRIENLREAVHWENCQNRGS